MKTVLADTGAWYALFDSRDPYHLEAAAVWELVQPMRIALPWPIVYETLRTKFVRNRVAIAQFESFLKSPRLIYIDDGPLRQAAFDMALDSSRRGRYLSMVDCLVRLLLEDVNTRIDYLATFNRGDFVDVCRRSRVEMIC